MSDTALIQGGDGSTEVFSTGFSFAAWIYTYTTHKGTIFATYDSSKTKQLEISILANTKMQVRFYDGYWATSQSQSSGYYSTGWSLIGLSSKNTRLTSFSSLTGTDKNDFTATDVSVSSQKYFTIGGSVEPSIGVQDVYQGIVHSYALTAKDVTAADWKQYFNAESKFLSP